MKRLEMLMNSPNGHNIYDTVSMFLSSVNNLNSDNTMAKRKRTDNTMAKRKRTKEQTTIYKTLHRKGKIEQKELH
jgi:hypothetical protein